jgi:hypothetical protein
MEQNSADRDGMDADRLLEHLTVWQHLRPHDLVRNVLSRAERTLGLCPQAAAQAVQWLQLDVERAIGRLGRTELIQLARSLHRHWRQRLHESAQFPAR